MKKSYPVWFCEVHEELGDQHGCAQHDYDILLDQERAPGPGDEPFEKCRMVLATVVVLDDE